MTTFKLYLLFTLLPAMSNLFAVIGLISLLLAVMAFGFFVSEGNNENDDRMYRKLLNAFSVTAICCWILYGIIPSKSDIFQIYIAKYITTNKDAKAIPHVFLEYISSEIKKNEGDK